MSFGGGSPGGWGGFQNRFGGGMGFGDPSGGMGGGMPWWMQGEAPAPSAGLPAQLPADDEVSAMPMPTPEGPAALPALPSYGSGDFGRPSARPAAPSSGGGFADKLKRASDARQASLNTGPKKNLGSLKNFSPFDNPYQTGRDRNGNATSGWGVMRAGDQWRKGIGG